MTAAHAQQSKPLTSCDALYCVLPIATVVIMTLDQRCLDTPASHLSCVLPNNLLCICTWLSPQRRYWAAFETSGAQGDPCSALLPF